MRQSNGNGQTRVIRPALSTNAIINPGKGWVLYGGPQRQPPDVLALGALGYQRYAWGRLEPDQGCYRWDVIDRDLAAWSAVGKPFAFGVMCASSHSREFWTSPKWVFDAGARYESFELKNPRRRTTGTEGTKLVPVFDDPVFLAKLKAFVAALAARYDGHPGLAFLDIRSYGNWGEGHMHPFGRPDIAEDKYLEHLALHREAFRKTLLMVCAQPRRYPLAMNWAVQNGIGIRRDGICGNSDGREGLLCYGRRPAVFELFGPYDMLKELGWWEGRKDADGNGHRLADCVETGKPSWCDLSRGGPSGLDMLTNERALVERLANRMGYHLVLSEARYPAVAAAGRPVGVELTWENRGVAPVYLAAQVRFALFRTDGSLADTCRAPTSRPADWQPDNAVPVRETLLFPCAGPGDYELAVGLCRTDSAAPTIRLGIDTPMHRLWHVLGPLHVTADGGRPFGLAKGRMRLPRNFNEPDSEIENLFSREADW
ncbi:MAG: DUF4832 domain-containing protein [Kiritimatiellae bacterium]|nr:DUF4832 domain-containing protein [Kiritimatiellia bacterium]